MTVGWVEVLALLRLGAAGGAMWILPWWRVSGRIGPGGHAAQALIAFLLGVTANVASSYCLMVTGAYAPEWGLIAHIVVSMAAMAWGRRCPTAAPKLQWPLILAMAAALALRLPDSLRHLALGGNDPWGHLVLCKALAMGDPIAGFHDFSFYPRGYHALVLTLHGASGLSPYEVMRFFGPLLSLMGVVGAYALARRASTPFGGWVAAFVYAVPAYRHLVLPSVQTSLEPDRFAFAFLPALLLLLVEAVEHGSRRAAAVLVGAGMAHVLIHPLSVQFMVAWIVCGAVAGLVTGARRPALSVLLAGAVMTLFAWAYYHVMHHSFGISAMAHLSPRASFTVGGHGVDLHRILLGTGWYVEWMDITAVVIVVVLGCAALRRRTMPPLLMALVLLHTAYAAARDALYLGDYGHAPPYYAMAFAWAAGSLVGDVRLESRRRLIPLAGMVVLAAHRLMTGESTPSQGVLLAVLGVVAAATVLSSRLRDGLCATFVGLAMFSLRPQPVNYARLGYPEAVRWAHELLLDHPGTVYSLGLISRLPDGRPFPTQDPVQSIVWPRHHTRRLSSLLGESPDMQWPSTRPVVAMVETVPYRWGFPYFARQERDAVMEGVLRWLADRTQRGAPVRIIESTERMLLVELHDPEDG
ncbi:hypothetical protein JXA88_16885 [Candidatus Fermentibacteria bacterium]|nr:hypothetical protein [Candidatus Fermentibacteria bacterium]